MTHHKQMFRERRPRRRTAFTLIELLVVSSLLLILAGLAVLFIPSLADQSREASGAAMLQGWLNIARTRALRDQAPRGLRLFPTLPPGTVGLPTGTTLPFPIVTEAQYVDQPDDLYGSSFSNATGGPGWTVQGAGSMLAMQGVDLFNGYPAQQALWTVQPGDYIEIQGAGVVHQITGIAQTGALSFNVSLASSLPYPVTQTSSFRVVRQPRVSGEERLSFPNNVGIDLNTNLAAAAGGYSGSGPAALAIMSNLVPNVNPTTQQIESYDILFAPAGNVIGSQTGSGSNQVILWVRDYTLQPPYVTYQQQGEPTLVTVGIQSGLVAAVPVDQSNGFQPGNNMGAAPYTFTLMP